jgi:integral membrane sensor domain MASE1
MLSAEEKAFIDFWEKNRQRQKKVTYQLLVGLPLGVLFTVPILLNFFSGWYKRATMVGNSQFNPLVLIVAALLIIIFLAVFSRKHRWDMNEQRYLELKAREGNDAAENPVN